MDSAAKQRGRPGLWRQRRSRCAVADTLAAEGTRIALASLPSDELTEAVGRVGAVTDAIAVPWDLADRSAIAPNVATVERQLGPVEIVVNIRAGHRPAPAAAPVGQRGAMTTTSPLRAGTGLDRDQPGEGPAPHARQEDGA